MSFFEKAKQAADRAAEQARIAAQQAGAQAKATTERVKRSMTHERLAELIVKATALQERTNDELRAKNSPYRIQEITVTASIPPNIGFTIARLADPELIGKVVESVEILEELGEVPVLDLEHPDDASTGATPSVPGGTTSG
jgi:hypothetical protein